MASLSRDRTLSDPIPSLGPWGPLDRLAAPALTAISVPVRSSAVGLTLIGRDKAAMQPLGGRRLPAIAGASPSAGVPDLLDLGPPTRDPTFQAPALATLGAGTDAPSQASDALL
jgi:hypothetical protein